MMFAKIFSQEVRNAWRLPAIMAVVALGFSVIVSFIIQYLWGGISDYRFTVPWAVRAVLWMVLAFYILYMIAANLMVLLFMPVRFYKEIYSDQGYLYHSLPLKKSQLLSAHVLSSGLLLLAYYVVDMGCLWILLRDLEDALDFMSIYYRIILREFRSILYMYEDRVTFLTVLMVIAIIVMPFVSVMQVYCAVTLGQMAKKHRIAMAFVWYFVLNLVTNIISNVITSAANRSFMEEYSIFSTTADQVMGAAQTAAIITLMTMVLGFVVFFVITHRRMQYHLNLE